MAEDNHLYQELENCLRAKDKEGAIEAYYQLVRAKDKEGAIEAYYQLLSAGWSLREIINAFPRRPDPSGSNQPNEQDAPSSTDREFALPSDKAPSELLASSSNVFTAAGGASEQVAGGESDDDILIASPQPPNDRFGDANPTRQRAGPTHGGEGGSLRRAAFVRSWRLAKQTVLFLIPGVAVAALTVAGAVFVDRPPETLTVRRTPPESAVPNGYKAERDQASKTLGMGAIVPSPGSKSSTARGSAVVKVTTSPDPILRTEATPAPAPPLVVASPTAEMPTPGLNAEKNLAGPKLLNQTEESAASSEKAAARAAAAVIASPERPTAPATVVAARPTVSASASATEGTAVARAAPAAPRLPTPEIAALLSRGDSFFQNADVVSARLFYQRAAEGGDGPAALRLGETFDPAFLAQAGMGTLMGDPTKAAFWYRQASELGVGDAVLLLKNVAPAKQR